MEQNYYDGELFLDFNEIIDSIRTFKGVTRKRSIADVREKLKDTYNISGKVHLAFGDDAAAIDIGNDMLMLLATDGIWGSLMEINPWWSGYCSVLVNVNDIAAMGGIPMGMTNVLSSSEPEITEQIMDGINEGVKKFGVPMVGGHTHPDTPYEAIDVAISGIVGTLGMLLEASNMGAHIEMEEIPRPDDVDWISWFKMYPGSAFVLTAQEENTQQLLKLLNKEHINANCIGKVTNNHKLTMTHQNTTKTVFDFNSEIIMGFSEDR